MNPKVDTRFKFPTDTSWHFERVLKPDDKTIGNYTLIQPGSADIVKVLGAYFHHPVPGYNIASIEIVYNEQLNRVFYGNMKMMNVRKGNPKYMPEWKNAALDVEKQQREATFQQFQNLSQPHGDPDVPNMHLLPLWHGTNDDVAEYIFNMGYGIFQTNPQFVTDDGYFGKGVYTAHEAEYSFRSYAKKHGAKAVLLLNWVSSFEAYPIIHGDMPKVQGKPLGYDNCDAHFIPVRSDQHPHTDIYFPCGLNQSHQYLEMVVFNPAQCLPRYKVKLVQSIPKPSIDDAALTAYQMGLDFLGLGQTMMVSQAFEQAHDAGHPAASVRLHWLHSGGSGIIPANLQELQKYRTLSNTSLAWLKEQANFRGNHHPESQFNLGWCYQHGLGVPINLAKAAQYYWIAANQGHADAQYQLGVCCASGIGVKKNMDKAIFYYSQAAEKGHIHAHYLLFQCYGLGLGIASDATKAALHRQAAQQGNHPQLIGLGQPTPLPQPAPIACNHPAEITQLRNELQQKEQALQQKHQALQQEKLLTQQKLQNEQLHQQQIAGLQQSVIQVTTEKTALQAELQNQQQQAQKQIQEKSQTIEQQRIKLQTQEKAVSKQTLVIGRLEAEINLLKAELKKAQAELNQLKQSPILPPKVSSSTGNFWSAAAKPQSLSEQVVAMSQSVMKQINSQDLTALFKWVTEGHLVEVEKLLQKTPKLALAVGTVKDLSDRKFNNVTALQYAAWTLDSEMCEVILKYLEPQHASMQFKTLSNEPQKHSQFGACYEIEPLITKTKIYLDNYDNWDSNKCRQYWQKEVGGEQRKCPAWLIYAWCETGDDVAWTKRDFKRKISRQYDKNWPLWWMTENYNSGRGVGSSWAIVRGDRIMGVMQEKKIKGTAGDWLVMVSVSQDVGCFQLCRQNRHEALDRLRTISNKHGSQASMVPGK